MRSISFACSISPYTCKRPQFLPIMSVDMADLSGEELTWLQASAILDVPPTPPPKDEDIFMQNLPLSTSSKIVPSTSTDSRSEWIYRSPKSLPNGRQRTPNPTRPQACPPSLSRSHSNASSPPLADTGSSLSAPFWSTILRPRSRSERSIPLLKTIPSQSQIVLTPPDFSTPIATSKRGASVAVRPPSISSTLSSMSTSNSSSRSESPVTPVSLSFSPYKHRRPLHRRHRTLENASSSCPPSKSILTRTSSVSTKDSSHTINKSVKFAAIPVVHYASRGYWDVETVDTHGSAMGINVESMDMDDPEELGARDTDRLRERQCTTPTPEREREKAKGLKRLMSINRKPTTGMTKSVATAHKPSSTLSGRPVISTPYALGAYPLQNGMQSTASLHGSHRKGHAAAGSAPDLIPDGPLPLRSAPSLESFRSSKSAAARSVRSMGSVKSTASTKGFRAWLGRTIGWTES